MANYDFVVNSHFTPFTLQEMLTPFAAYKEEYDKTEAAYDKLAEADNFKYLSQTLPKGSRARDIYEGYANDLEEQAKDFAQNGLTMSNKGALTSLKRRYRGEIGRLIKADEALKEEKKLRQTLNAQDSSRLYATDNLNIDSFLDGESPNLYSISGNELYTKGAAAAKAAASRVYNVNGEAKTLGGYYLDFAQSVGYDADMMKAFTENIANIPELAAQVDNILMERGVYKNLTGENLKRARQSVINGMIDGAVYSESHNPQRNLGVLSAAEEESSKLQKQNAKLNLWKEGAMEDEDGNIIADKDNPNWIAKKVANEAIEAQTDALYPKDEHGVRHYNPLLKKGKDGISVVSADNTTNKEEDSLGTALSKLDKKTLGHNKGFSVSYNSGRNRKNYSYLGAIVESKDTNHKWMSGKLGEDNPSHNGLASWAHMSSSNLDTAFGNLTAQKAEDGMRVLTANEVEALMPGFNDAPEDYNDIQKTITSFIGENMKANPAAFGLTQKQVDQVTNTKELWKYSLKDIQLIEVPREDGSSRKEYLIALEQ